uniref:Mid2 domain-containing protein n=1 Tax=Gibberella zeae (strain ATCC MYA-4620 / CBS 123657 / FGSC 9075 / NRRL 31084 / PH-1) TaxID=229533 RepID=A0A098DKK6_GIBZE
MQLTIQAILLFHFCIRWANALYAKFPTPTETSAPSRTDGLVAQRGVPSEMITCGYKNGDPEAVRTPAAGSVCRFSTQNGLWATTCKKEQYCSFAYLIMDEGHKYTYMACGAVAATDTFFMTPKVPQLTKPGPETLTAETSGPSSSTTDETTPSETLSETVTEASDNNGSRRSSNVGAIVGGVVGGLAVVCGTAIVALYLLRKNNEHKPKSEKGTSEATSPTSPNDGPKELTGSNPSELQGTAIPTPQLPLVELS